MSKSHYFSNKNFKNRRTLGALRVRPNFRYWWSNLKLRNLAKLWIFKPIMSKSNLQQSVMASFQWHHHNYVNKIMSQFFPFFNFWLR